MVVLGTLRGGRLVLSTACLVLAVACGGGSDGKAQTSPEDDRIIAEIAFAKTLADRAPSLNSGDHTALWGWASPFVTGCGPARRLARSAGY